MSAGCGLIMHCPALPHRQTCSECGHYRPFAARRRICQACRSHVSHKRLSDEGQRAPAPSPLKRARSDQGEAAASLTAVIAPLPSASTASRTESVTCVPQRESSAGICATNHSHDGAVALCTDSDLPLPLRRSLHGRSSRSLPRRSHPASMVRVRSAGAACIREGSSALLEGARLCLCARVRQDRDAVPNIESGLVRATMRMPGR